jgi:hypothetical protein
MVIFCGVSQQAFGASLSVTCLYYNIPLATLIAILIYDCNDYYCKGLRYQYILQYSYVPIPMQYIALLQYIAIAINWSLCLHDGQNGQGILMLCAVS